MWKIMQIFDGDYGCEELAPGAKPKVSVTLENENGERIYRSVEDEWLAENGLDVGSLWPQDYYNEEFLYKLFGINAELLIDHAWGWEPCPISEIKAYKPETNSISSGQVLQCPYPADKAKLIVREMADHLALELVEKKLVTDQIVLTLGYDIENLTDAAIRKSYHGEVTTDRYGRKVPKHAHGTENLKRQTNSGKLITDATMTLFDRIMNPKLLVRRVTLVANHLISEGEAAQTAADS